MTADASRSDASAAEPGAESGASSEGARNDDAIVVWRPERRAPAHRGAGRRARRERNEFPPGEHSRVGRRAARTMSVAARLPLLNECAT